MANNLTTEGLRKPTSKLEKIIELMASGNYDGQEIEPDERMSKLEQYLLYISEHGFALDVLKGKSDEEIINIIKDAITAGTIDVGVDDSEVISIINTGIANATVNATTKIYVDTQDTTTLNDAKAYTNTQIGLVSIAPTPVSLVADMTDTSITYLYTGVEDGYVIGEWYYYNGSEWTSGGIYQATTIADGSVTSAKLETTLSTNIDNSPIYANCKTDSCTGEALAGAIIDMKAYSITVPIGSTGLYSYLTKKISSKYLMGKKVQLIITFHKPSTVSSWSSYFTPSLTHNSATITPDSTVAVDSNTNKKTYTITSVSTDITFTLQNNMAMPTDVKRVWGIDSVDFVVLSNSAITSNSDNINNALRTYDRGLREDINMPITNVVRVKKDGSMDYVDPYSATEAVKSLAGAKNIYNIELYDDEYDIISYLPSSMVNSPAETINNRGWEIPNYVNIIGKTAGQVHLKGELPDTCTTTQCQAMSTVNIAQNCNLENLYITAKNLRYPVHDESTNFYKNWIRNVKNCKIEHLGNADGLWTSTTAWGEGDSSGSYSVFEDCEFIGVNGMPGFSTHNNTGYTSPSKHKFVNCKANAYRFGSMGSGQKDQVILIGCEIPDLKLIEELSNGCGIDFVIKGYGNTNPLYSVTNTDGNTYSYIFREESMELINEDVSTIAKGKLVKLNSTKGVIPLLTTDTTTVLYGVAMVNIATGSKGIVKYKGYIKLTDLGVVANVGDKIGIVNGVATVVTSGDYFAKVIYSGYAKFI